MAWICNLHIFTKLVFCEPSFKLCAILGLIFASDYVHTNTYTGKHLTNVIKFFRWLWLFTFQTVNLS